MFKSILNAEELDCLRNGFLDDRDIILFVYSGEVESCLMDENPGDYICEFLYKLYEKGLKILLIISIVLEM